MEKELILILDFGSQYTQLIARRIRENSVFSEIVPCDTELKKIIEFSPKGIIFSGGPLSVYEEKAPLIDVKIFEVGIPILGICYGLQVIAHLLGGEVIKGTRREYGKATLYIDERTTLFQEIPAEINCWMSHQDRILKLPSGFVRLAHTTNSPYAAIVHKKKKIFGVQFHPEVQHTDFGKQILKNFAFDICGCQGNWTMDNFLETATKKIKETVGNSNVICGLSGGIDSSVTAVLINRAVSGQLYPIFVDNGLLRKNETDRVKELFQKKFGKNFTFIEARRRFLEKLKGIIDPEEKRKVIGEEFIRIFEEEAAKIPNTKFLAQGTLYPDVIESRSFWGGPSAKIKTHHNVGGLPERMSLRLIEPLKELFKDEVRILAKFLNLPEEILWRQPFPGPGLAVRIIGEVTPERLEILRESDERVLEEIRRANLYKEIWQSFAVLLPVKTVGVMGDERTYENVVAIRAVTSLDGMTADWAKIPYEVLGRISNRIINEVKGVNRVVFDISSKPPATIEWE